MAKKSNYRKGELSYLGQWLPLPTDLLRSPEYRKLSASAIKLLFDVVAQFNGRNNGGLSPTWELMKDYGWKSKETLNNAKKELLKTRFITVTRQGRAGINGYPELWALTWLKLDYHPDFDIKPSGHDFMGYITLKIDPDAKEKQQREKLVKTALKAAGK